MMATKSVVMFLSTGKGQERVRLYCIRKGWLTETDELTYSGFHAWDCGWRGEGFKDELGIGRLKPWRLPGAPEELIAYHKKRGTY